MKKKKSISEKISEKEEKYKWNEQEKISEKEEEKIGEKEVKICVKKRKI